MPHFKINKGSFELPKKKMQTTTLFQACKLDFLKVELHFGLSHKYLCKNIQTHRILEFRLRWIHHYWRHSSFWECLFSTRSIIQSYVHHPVNIVSILKEVVTEKIEIMTHERKKKLWNKKHQLETCRMSTEAIISILFAFQITC